MNLRSAFLFGVCVVVALAALLAGQRHTIDSLQEQIRRLAIAAAQVPVWEDRLRQADEELKRALLKAQELQDQVDSFKRRVQDLEAATQSARPRRQPQPSQPAQPPEQPTHVLLTPIQTVVPAIPSQPQSVPRSVRNGIVLQDVAWPGPGKLEVANGTDRDAVVKLVSVSSGKAAAIFCVQHGNSASYGRIPDGQYWVVYTQGVDWDHATGTFAQDRSYAKFEEVLNFTTTDRRAGDQISRETSRYKLTLHKVLDGHARTTALRESEFLSY